MTNESREQRLDSILHGYLQAIDRGANPDRQAILNANPDLRDECQRQAQARAAQIEALEDRITT